MFCWRREECWEFRVDAAAWLGAFLASEQAWAARPLSGERAGLNMPKTDCQECFVIGSCCKARKVRETKHRGVAGVWSVPGDVLVYDAICLRV